MGSSLQHLAVGQGHALMACENRHATAGDMLLDQARKHVDRLDIERGEGFIEYPQRRLAHREAGEQHAALLAGGEQTGGIGGEA